MNRLLILYCGITLLECFWVAAHYSSADLRDYWGAFMIFIGIELLKFEMFQWGRS